MSLDISKRPDDDALQFADEGMHSGASSSHDAWKVLIVDDDEQVHQATVFALADLVVHGRSLAFLHAYSAEQAVAILRATPDVAVIFLDVVMETEDTGLRMVRVVREELKLREARIILRTGQPGYAPEIEAIRDYDINDYRTKSELTRTRLVTSLTAAIRSYEQIRTISYSRQGLEKIVRAASELFEKRALESFAEGVLTQIASVLGIPPNGVVCAQRGAPVDGSDADNLYVIGAVGSLAAAINHPVRDIDDVRIRDAITRCMERRQNLHEDAVTVLYLKFEDREAAVFVDSPVPLEPLDIQLLEVFTTNISVGFANVHLFHRLNYLAYYDTLTGLPNRRTLGEELDRRRGAGVRPLTLCLVDIDQFSDINDALGSAFGDALLVAAANRLQQDLPPSAFVARISADVFAIVGESGAVSGETILSLFRDPFRLLEDSPLTVSVTLGVVHLEHGDWAAKDVLQQAAIALSRAKGQARGEYVAYTEQMADESRTRLALLHDLRTAMRRSELQLHFQPQIELASGRIVGAEALLRWPRADGSYVAPAEFIPVAERSGLIVELGDWVLTEACRQLLEWTYAGLGDIRLAINVAMPQFRAGVFAPRLKRLIAENALPAAALEIEITESMLMEDMDATVATINALKEVGVSVAIDDFGTGFSSLAYLQRLPVDVMKIDRAFVREIGSGTSGERIAEMIVALGRTLDLKTVAEGVETAEQAEIVRAWGCQFAQGYHYARPMGSADFIAWARDRRAASGAA